MSSSWRFFFAALFLAARAFAQTQPGNTPSNSKPEDRCIVQGRAINSITGEPLKKVIVRLSAAGVRSNAVKSPTYSARSEADGSFSIANVEPGTYYLHGSRTGYLDTVYGARRRSDTGATLTLRAGQQLTNITLALIPQAIIGGKVVDEDGDPVANANVMLIGQSWQRGKLVYAPQNGSRTNDLGEFRISNVRPGKYYVFVEGFGNKQGPDVSAQPGKPDIRPVKTFYPAAARLEDATPVDVKAAQELPSIDIRQLTAATYHIRGKIVGNLPENGTERLDVNASPRDEQDTTFGGGAIVGKDRSFDIAGLAPGPYTLKLFLFGGQVESVGHEDVDVGQADVNDVQLPISPPLSLRGQVFLEGNPATGTSANDVSKVHFWLYSANNTMMFKGAIECKPKEDGTFTADNLDGPRYYVSPDPPSGTYLKSLRFGNQELLGKELDFSQGAGPLTVVFSYNGAQLSGTIQQPESNSTPTDASGTAQPSPAATAVVAVIPDVLNEDGTGMHFEDANSDGSFTAKQLPPGRYHAYAFAEVDREQLQNPDLRKQLESLGAEVELKENEKKQLQLPLISAQDMQQIYAGLGIEVP